MGGDNRVVHKEKCGKARRPLGKSWLMIIPTPVRASGLVNDLRLDNVRKSGRKRKNKKLKGDGLRTMVIPRGLMSHEQGDTRKKKKRRAQRAAKQEYLS